MMRALVVDDEPVARQVLRELLADLPGVAVVGEAASGPEALEAIRVLHPDVAFLDLEMPGLDGLGVARALRGDILPLVIFVTAYDQHALQAFESGAVDYLLKPVRPDRLAEAVDKARRQLAGFTAGAPRNQPAPAPQRITGRLGSNLHMLDLDSVIAFQAEGELVHIISTEGRFLAGKTLRELEQRLPSGRFRRIRRNTIINTCHIRTISPWTSKRWLLRMSNGMEAVVSKRLAGSIREETRW